MKTFRVCLTALVAPVLLSVSAAAQITAPAGGATVPMLNVGGRPVIEVSINGAAPVRVILDTGASHTVIDPAWVGGATGRQSVKEVRIGELVMQNADVSSRVLFGGTLPPEFPRGVFSALSFPGYLVTFDYPGKTVTFRKGALPEADGKRVFAYDDTDPLPKVPVMVAGHEYRIHVDSGSPSGIMLPLRAAKEVPLAAELSLAGRARTNVGEFEVFTAPVKGAVTLGEFTIDVPLVRFSDLSPGGGPGPGNLGYEVLRTFSLVLDSTNRRISFGR